MPVTLPTASEAVDEARKIADSIVESFRKYTDAHDPSPEAMAEQHVLASIGFFYYERPAGSAHFDHTIGAKLIDSEAAMAYMGFPEQVLQTLHARMFRGKGQVWRRDVSEWALSWDEEEDD